MPARVVVVTGASGGVGRAVVRELAGPGVAIGLLARGEAGLAAAAAEVEAAGGTALAVPTDVADAAQVESAAARIEDELGPIDTWINVAFSSVFAPFTQISTEEFVRATEVTYLGYVHATKAALDRMLPRDRGTIVQVGSALSYRGIPLQSAYCGAKHAMVGFTESLRTELMHDGSNVRVTMVHLPAVNTPQFTWVLSKLPNHPQPVPPIFQPEVAARAIVQAAADPRRREYYVGSSTVATVLGNKLAGGLLDRYLALTGYDSQQTAEPTSPDRPSNLFAPVDDDRDLGAHGEFDDRATSSSWQASFTGSAWVVAGAVNLVALAVAGARMVWGDKEAFAKAVTWRR